MAVLWLEGTPRFKIEGCLGQCPRQASSLGGRGMHVAASVMIRAFFSKRSMHARNLFYLLLRRGEDDIEFS